MMKSQRVWILLLTVLTPLSQAFSARDQGYFDLGLGPTMLDDNTYVGSETIEYSPGLQLTTSVGLTYKNGLGLGINYSFSYNNKRGSDLLDAGISPEVVSSTFIVDFQYKIMPASSVSLVIHAGPGMLISSDQSLKQSAAQEETSSTATNTTTTAVTSTITNGVSTPTEEVVTTTATGATESVNESPQFETFDHFSFAYEIGASLEYREDNHKAYALQINYLQSTIFKTTFDDDDPNTVSSKEGDPLNNLSTSIILRYYM